MPRPGRVYMPAPASARLFRPITAMMQGYSHPAWSGDRSDAFRAPLGDTAVPPLDTHYMAKLLDEFPEPSTLPLPGPPLHRLYGALSSADQMAQFVAGPLPARPHWRTSRDSALRCVTPWLQASSS